MSTAVHTKVWIGALMDREDAAAINNMLSFEDLPPILDEVPHCTVLYSNNAKGIEHIETYATPFEAKHVGWEILNFGKDNRQLADQGGILVMRLECKELSDRHEELMKIEGATHSHDGFTLHVSLSGHARPDFLETRWLPLMPYKIRFTGEAIKRK